LLQVTSLPVTSYYPTLPFSYTGKHFDDDDSDSDNDECISVPL